MRRVDSPTSVVYIIFEGYLDGAREAVIVYKDLASAIQYVTDTFKIFDLELPESKGNFTYKRYFTNSDDVHFKYMDIQTYSVWSQDAPADSK